MRRLATLVLLLMLPLAACGDDGDSGSSGGSPSKKPKAESTVAPEGAALTVEAPAAGATVGTDVAVVVEAAGVKMRKKDDAGAVLIAFIDTEPVLDQPSKTEKGKVQRFTRRTLLTGLAPGPHTVKIVLANRRGVPYQPVVQTEVAFTVDPAAPKDTGKPEEPAPDATG